MLTILMPKVFIFTNYERVSSVYPTVFGIACFNFLKSLTYSMTSLKILPAYMNDGWQDEIIHP